MAERQAPRWKHPLATTFSPPPADQGDVGALSITVAKLAVAVPATYSGTYA